MKALAEQRKSNNILAAQVSERGEVFSIKDLSLPAKETINSATLPTLNNKINSTSLLRAAIELRGAANTDDLHGAKTFDSPGFTDGAVPIALAGDKSHHTSLNRAGNGHQDIPNNIYDYNAKAFEIPGRIKAEISSGFLAESLKNKPAHEPTLLDRFVDGVKTIWSYISPVALAQKVINYFSPRKNNAQNFEENIINKGLSEISKIPRALDESQRIYDYQLKGGMASWGAFPAKFYELSGTPALTMKESAAYMRALDIERNKALWNSLIESGNVIADDLLATENIKPVTKTEKDGN